MSTTSIYTLSLHDALPISVTAAPDFSYALTTMSNPVGPGQHAVFIWTVTSLDRKRTRLNSSHMSVAYAVTRWRTIACTGNVTPPPGKSASGIIDLTVLSGF